VAGLALASSEGGSGSSPILRIAVAALIVVLAIAAYIYFGDKPPVATGEVLHVTAYPVHRDSSGALSTSRAARVETTFDEIIVVADLRLRNQSTGPVFLSDMAALLKLPSEEDRSLAANARDYERVFAAYPELANLKQQPLLRDTTIPAGGTAEGQLVFNYPLTKQQWEQRQSLDISLSFLHQKDLVLPAPQ
jgi:hypothetical protein